MQVGSSSAFLLKAGFLDELPHCWMLPEKIYFPIQDGCKIGICEPTLYKTMKLPLVVLCKL